MKVYKVRHKKLQSNVCWKDLIHAVEEINMHMIEGEVGDAVEIEIGEMSEEEYENLQEFVGY